MRSSNRFWIAAAMFAVAAGAWLPRPAAEGQTPSRNAVARTERLQSGDVDTDRSRVYVYVGKTGLGHEHGIEGRIAAGNLTLGASDNAGRIVFDMPSFDGDTQAARKYVGLEGTTDASTRREVTANMLGSAVLDVRKFPTAVFQVKSALPLVDKQRRHVGYQLDGQFTLHGITRPLRVNAESTNADGSVHLRCSFSILQTQFGIKPFTKAFGVVGVADRLTIYGDAWLAGPREEP